LALDPQGLYEVIRREDISMCGYGPTVAMLTAAKELGAKKAELIKYATSAEASGDRSAVVGYAGIIVS
jgi:AmmeMemoRadiSam system protein B